MTAVPVPTTPAGAETKPGGQLTEGYMRVEHAGADDRFPACVKIVSGLRWDNPADLRTAAQLLVEGADWLEREKYEGQPSLFEDSTA